MHTPKSHQHVAHTHTYNIDNDTPIWVVVHIVHQQAFTDLPHLPPRFMCYFRSQTLHLELGAQSAPYKGPGGCKGFAKSTPALHGHGTGK